MDKVDILIVGAGLTGSILMLALKNSGLNTLLLDQNNKINYDNINKDFLDTRTLTLSDASIKILQKLNIWHAIINDTNPIETIHVSQKNNFGIIKFTSQKSPLGYVISINLLAKKIYEFLNPDNIAFSTTLIDYDSLAQVATIQQNGIQKKIHTKLLVAADGTNSKVRELLNIDAQRKKYDQSAIVTNILLRNDHKNCAYERFTKLGLVAALPMTNKRIGFVWCLENTHTKNILNLSDQDFLKAAQNEFGHRLGKFISTGPRVLYPLTQTITQQSIKTITSLCVFIGNAAQTIHPVAGQGFNLGLRDVITLRDHIITHGINSQMLEKYQQLRAKDKKIISAATDHIINIFSKKIPGLQTIRSIGLLAIDNIIPIKNLIAHYAKGHGGYNKISFSNE